MNEEKGRTNSGDRLDIDPISAWEPKDMSEAENLLASLGNDTVDVPQPSDLYTAAAVVDGGVIRTPISYNNTSASSNKNSNNKGDSWYLLGGVAALKNKASGDFWQSGILQGKNSGDSGGTEPEIGSWDEEVARFEADEDNFSFASNIGAGQKTASAVYVASPLADGKKSDNGDTQSGSAFGPQSDDAAIINNDNLPQRAAVLQEEQADAFEFSKDFEEGQAEQKNAAPAIEKSAKPFKELLSVEDVGFDDSARTNPPPLYSPYPSIGESRSDDEMSVGIKRMMSIVTVGCFVPVILIWGMLFYSLNLHRNIAVDRMYDRTLGMAEILREQAEKNIATADQFTAFFKNGWENGSFSSLSSVISNFSQNSPYTIYVMDQNGNLLGGSYNGSASLLRGLFADHYTIHKKIDTGSLYIGRSIWNDWSQSWLFTVSRRLNHSDKSFAGMIVVTLDPRNFFDYSLPDGTENDMRTYLVGHDFIIRATKNKSLDFVDSTIDDAAVRQELKGGMSGSFSVGTGENGEPYIYSYSALKDYPLFVIVGYTKDVAVSGTTGRAIAYLVIAIVCMISGFSLWRLLVGLIAKQHATENDLRRIKSELEHSVEMRTAELTEANATLTETNNSLSILNRDLGDEIENRRLAEEKRRLADEKLKFIAYHDPITNAPNRTYITEWIDNDLKKQGTGIIARIYINDLQEMKDAFGYTFGNEIICAVAKELASPENGLYGSVLSHIGFGRFSAVYPGLASITQAEEIAETIKAALARITEVHSVFVHITATVGFVFYPKHGTTADELLLKSDNAAVAARTEKHTDWCVYEDTMKETLQSRITLTAQLHQAISHGEFLLVYQPKVSVRTGKVKSFEALIRWHSPLLGMVRPDRFIPQAEQNGLIIPIDQWVLGEACRFARRVVEAGWSSITIAVNVSGIQFAADDFIETVRDTIAKSGVNETNIELEVTETAVIDNVEEAIRKIRQLRYEGIKIALDDFGVRYSTLSYLVRLPFDSLKIDKSFIDAMDNTEHGNDIVRMIIELAHLLGKEVIAEGVETREQYERLERYQCDYIQGYYFSMPLNEINAFEYLRREERWSL